jgi:hypothetical protein
MPKRILIKAPGRVVVSGRQYQFGNDEVGKTLLLPDHEANAILEGVSKHNFTFIANEPNGAAISIHNLNVTAVVKPTKKLTPITKHSEWATPYAPGTTPDPIYFEEPKPVAEVKPEPEQVKEEPFVSEVQEEPAPVVEEQEVGLDPKAHWSKVKALLVDMEESGEYDYELVMEIKEVYPSYEAIQKECDRILEEAGLA